MLAAISRMTTGFVVVSIKGEHCQRFINLCIKNGIRFWHYHREGEAYVLSLRIGDYRLLRGIRRRCPVKITLIKKKGLPFRLHPLKKHPGLIVGFITAVGLYLFLAGHVWVVGVSGAGEYSEAHILSVAKEAGVFVGAGKENFEEARAAQKIMRALPNLEWVSVNTSGCTAEIAVRHSRKKPDILEEEGVQNLVARKNGVIRSIEIPDGMVRVEVGEAVQAGDLLVSGMWDSNEKQPDWKRTDQVKIFTAASRGVIMAETTRSFTAKIPKTETLYETGGKAYRFAVNFFGLSIPFTPSFVGEGEYRRKAEEESLYLLDVKLPISLKTETLTRMVPHSKTLSQEQARERLDQTLEKTLEKEIAQGDSILERGDVVYGEEKGFYTAKINCVCLENIVSTKKVLLE